MFTARPFPRTAGLVAVAALMLSVATGRAAPLVYVPTGDAGEVEIVDAATDRVVGRLDGFQAAHGLGASADGRYLVVGSFTTMDEGTAPPRPAGVSAEDHAAHHGGAAGTPNQGPDASLLSIFDVEAGTIVRRIEVPGAVHHVAVSPDGLTAAITHPNDDLISIVDLARPAVTASLSAGAAPNYAIYTPDGERLLVSASGDGQIVVLDAETLAEEGRIAVGAEPEHMVLSPDGARLFVNNVADGTVTAVDLANRTVRATYPIGAAIHGIDLTDDGTALIVSVVGDDRLARIDLATGAVTTATLAGAPYHVTSVAGTGKVYVSSASDPKLTVLDQRDLSVLGAIQLGGIGHQMRTIDSLSEKGATQ